MLTTNYAPKKFVNVLAGQSIVAPWTAISAQQVRVLQADGVTPVSASAYSVIELPAGGLQIIFASSLVGVHYIVRETPALQLREIGNQTAFDAELVEATWDYQMQVAQEQEEKLSRALIVPMGTSVGPMRPGQAGQTLMWGVDGAVVPGPDSADLASAAQVLAAAEAALQAAPYSFPGLSALRTTQQAFPPGAVIATRAEGYAYEVVASDPDLTTAGGVRLRVLPRDGGEIPAGAFGVVADGVTDDTAALRKAVARAQALVRDANTNKQKDGADVVLPKGLVRITGTITVTESNIRIRGVSASASVLYAPSANFDLLVFERPGWALYNCGVSDLRFSTPGNATAGYHLKVMNCIYFNHRDTLFNGWWGGIYIAAGGKIYNSNVVWSQEVRNPATPLTGAAITIGAEYAITGDVHFTDCQVMEDINTAGVNSVIIRCGDGIYFNNTHVHGTVLVEPRGTGGETTLSSLVFASCYLDASRDVCLILAGAPTYEYRDVRLENTYVRGGVMGIRVNTTTPLVGLSIRGGTIAQHQYWGIECLNANLIDMKIDGVSFDANNQADFGLVGDIRLNGVGSKVTGCTFTGGKPGGRSIQIDAGANYAQMRNLSWANSTVPQAQRVADAGTATAMAGLTGYPVKNQGSLTVPSGAPVAHIAHGLAFSPPLGAIKITPYGQLPAWWVSNVTATQFTINFASALSAERAIAWSVDVES